MANTLRIPGMFDPHVHLRGMDWSHKGTFASETAAAAAGGYWGVLDMPNTAPSTITCETLDHKLREINAQAVCDWGVYFGAAQTGNYEEFSLAVRDACGLKIYNNTTTGDLLVDTPEVREQHFINWPEHRVIAVHAEGDMVANILDLVRIYRKHTHFCHISTAVEIRLLMQAKFEDLPISIGVCPHHLFLTEDDGRALGALGLMKPELKTKADQEALWEAVQSGIVDVIESDHAPHTLEEKSSDNPPYGVPGLETTLPLLLSAVDEGRLTVQRVIELVAKSPRMIFGLPCPPETYTVVDLDSKPIISRNHLQTQCGWTPFEGIRAGGKVIETRIRGHKVYDGERVLVRPGFGQNIFNPV